MNKRRPKTQARRGRTQSGRVTPKGGLPVPAPRSRQAGVDAGGSEAEVVDAFDRPPLASVPVDYWRGPLEDLRVLQVERKSVDARIAGAVRTARIEGITWTEIGSVLGVSKQAARQKFGVD